MAYFLKRLLKLGDLFSKHKWTYLNDEGEPTKNIVDSEARICQLCGKCQYYSAYAAQQTDGWITTNLKDLLSHLKEMKVFWESEQKKEQEALEYLKRYS